MDTEPWYQAALTPPEVIEVNIRLGIVIDSDHAQLLVEMKDPRTGVLIGQASRPHFRIAEVEQQLLWAVARGTNWVHEHVDPF